MAKSIFGINVFITVNKIFFPCVIRWIYVNKVNFALMCLFKQLQGGEVVALDEEVHLPAVVNKQVFFFGQNGRILFQNLVDFFAVLFKHQPILFALDVLFYIGNIREQACRILILRRGSDIRLYRFYLCDQLFALFF